MVESRGEIVKAVGRIISARGTSYQWTGRVVEVDLYKTRHITEDIDAHYRSLQRPTAEQTEDYDKLRRRLQLLGEEGERRLRAGHVDSDGTRIIQARLSREAVERELWKAFAILRGMTREDIERCDTRERRLAYEIMNDMLEDDGIFEQLNTALQETALSESERTSAVHALIERQYASHR